MSANVWGLILAAGEGSRLRQLTTTPGGVAVPKQFCSLHGGHSLLEETLRRAESVAHRTRTVSVVAAQHRRWWETVLRSAPRDNVIVQPENKGTAAGLLLPLLHIAQRDPGAIVVVLPADHYVAKEAVLARSLQRAVRLANIDHRHVFMLGLTPEEADTELGYILPSKGSLSAASVQQFVEKPAAPVAEALVRAGALWNAFILAASVRGLLSLYAKGHSRLLHCLTEVANRDAYTTRDAPHAAQAYPDLAALDFSRDVLEGQEHLLRVITVPQCGWSDLGTPSRVVATLQRLESARRVPLLKSNAYLSLAAQHLRQQYAS